MINTTVTIMQMVIKIETDIMEIMGIVIMTNILTSAITIWKKTAKRNRRRGEREIIKSQHKIPLSTSCSLYKLFY
jgi:hypothetical protein